MLKIFTIKFKDQLESFNDTDIMLHQFPADKTIIRWESRTILGGETFIGLFPCNLFQL